MLEVRDLGDNGDFLREFEIVIPWALVQHQRCSGGLILVDLRHAHVQLSQVRPLGGLKGHQKLVLDRWHREPYEATQVLALRLPLSRLAAFPVGPDKLNRKQSTRRWRAGGANPPEKSRHCFPCASQSWFLGSSNLR